VPPSAVPPSSVPPSSVPPLESMPASEPEAVSGPKPGGIHTPSVHANPLGQRSSTASGSHVTTQNPCRHTSPSGHDVVPGSHIRPHTPIVASEPPPMKPPPDTSRPRSMHSRSPGHRVCATSQPPAHTPLKHARYEPFCGQSSSKVAVVHGIWHRPSMHDSSSGHWSEELHG